MAILACALVTATSSPATTITFDSIASSGNPHPLSITTQGFTFASDYFNTIDTPGSVGFGGAVSDNTIYIAEVGGLLGKPITMSMSGGGTFSLNSLYGSKFFLNSATAATGGFPNAGSLNIVGYLSGGGTVTAAFSLSSSFQQFVLPASFNGLTAVVFSGVLASGLSGGAIAVDNISVNSTSVPDAGSTFLLLAVVLAGVSLAKKKLRRTELVMKPVRIRQ